MLVKLTPSPRVDDERIKLFFLLQVYPLSKQRRKGEDRIVDKINTEN